MAKLTRSLGPFIGIRFYFRNNKLVSKGQLIIWKHKINQDTKTNSENRRKQFSALYILKMNVTILPH